MPGSISSPAALRSPSSSATSTDPPSPPGATFAGDSADMLPGPPSRVPRGPTGPPRTAGGELWVGGPRVAWAGFPARCAPPRGLAPTRRE